MLACQVLLLLELLCQPEISVILANRKTGQKCQKGASFEEKNRN
jgi:hypothetical protein